MLSEIETSPLAALCGGNASAYLAVNASSAALGFGRWPRPDDCVLQIVAGAAARAAASASASPAFAASAQFSICQL